MKEKNSDIQLLTIKEVAAYLKISERSVRRYSDRGKLPSPINVATLPRWRQKDIEDWQNDQAA